MNRLEEMKLLSVEEIWEKFAQREKHIEQLCDIGAKNLTAVLELREELKEAKELLELAAQALPRGSALAMNIKEFLNQEEDDDPFS